MLPILLWLTMVMGKIRVQAIGGSLSVMGQSPALQMLNNLSIPTNSFTIRHSHLFQTWGYKFHLFAQDGAKKSFLLHYPLALVPVDFLPFYLSPQNLQICIMQLKLKNYVLKLLQKALDAVLKQVLPLVQVQIISKPYLVLVL